MAHTTNIPPAILPHQDDDDSRLPLRSALLVWILGSVLGWAVLVALSVGIVRLVS